jgi:Cell wall-active antibiotics response 4TMS YvqF
MRRLGVFFLGFYAGLVAAAALLKRALPSYGDEESDEVALTAIFGGIELKSRAQAFRGGSMLAWFGGIAVDLREAQLAPNARLTVGALFGGVAIRVPMGWRVESSLRPIAGGVDVQVPDPEDPNAPTLIIEGLAGFGGVAIGAKADT